MNSDIVKQTITRANLSKNEFGDESLAHDPNFVDRLKFLAQIPSPSDVEEIPFLLPVPFSEMNRIDYCNFVSELAGDINPFIKPTDEELKRTLEDERKTHDPDWTKTKIVRLSVDVLNSVGERNLECGNEVPKCSRKCGVEDKFSVEYDKICKCD